MARVGRTDLPLSNNQQGSIPTFVANSCRRNLQSRICGCRKFSVVDVDLTALSFNDRNMRVPRFFFFSEESSRKTRVNNERPRDLRNVHIFKCSFVNVHFAIGFEIRYTGGIRMKQDKTLRRNTCRTCKNARKRQWKMRHRFVAGGNWHDRPVSRCKKILTGTYSVDLVIRDAIPSYVVWLSCFSRLIVIYIILLHRAKAVERVVYCFLPAKMFYIVCNIFHIEVH